MPSERDKASENPYEPSSAPSANVNAGRTKSIEDFVNAAFLVIISLTVAAVIAFCGMLFLGWHAWATFEKSDELPKFISPPMTSQHDKVKRWRPRFSVRTLVIVVTLACCYLGLWQATKLRGGNDVVLQSLGMVENSRYAYAEAIGPLLVNKTLDCGRGSNRRLKDHYYFWCFGYVAKLPFEREI